jgi:hypothetical protein
MKLLKRQPSIIEFDLSVILTLLFAGVTLGGFFAFELSGDEFNLFMQLPEWCFAAYLALFALAGVLSVSMWIRMVRDAKEMRRRGRDLRHRWLRRVFDDGPLGYGVQPLSFVSIVLYYFLEYRPRRLHGD